ncbi:MAG: glycosylase [Phycisphaeraceae bacterium]|nr:glycosylase [Phycisphaeraceae bacterium]
MLPRLFTECLVRPGDLEPSSPHLEVIGTFNPGAVRANDDVVLLVRVAERPAERPDGFVALPRYAPDGRLVIDQVARDDVEFIDARGVRMRHDGAIRLTFVSHLRVVRLTAGGRSVASADGPRFMPSGPYETYGVEDPRITSLNGRYYFTYVAVSRWGAATALASTTDFRTFERHGIIFCCENKDVVLFPGRIGGRYVALHRPNPSSHFSPPAMWLASSEDLLDWGAHRPLALAGNAPGDDADGWDSGRVGAGCPPIATDRGWLEIYHGNDRLESATDGDVGRYCGAAVLLDREDPGNVVARGKGPVMVPQEDCETRGFVPDVVFPTGIVEQDDTLLIYCGAADTHVTVVGLSQRHLLSRLEP